MSWAAPKRCCLVGALLIASAAPARGISVRFLSWHTPVVGNLLVSEGLVRAAAARDAARFNNEGPRADVSMAASGAVIAERYAVLEVPKFMKSARPGLTRRRLDECVNDDYSSDEYTNSCSAYYDSSSADLENCGAWDDSNFAASVQCCACGGGTRCDIVVSGSSPPELHGTYEQKGSCNGYPRWKCDEDGGCGQDQYIWYYSDYSNWHIGPDSCSGSAAIYISDSNADPDQDLTATVSGTWNEYVDGEWQPNSAISVACASGKISGSSPDSNIRTAVAAWLSDATATEATYGHISGWDTSQVTDMSYLFCADTSSSSGLCNAGAASFNEDIREWDTSEVTDMAYMFREASSFNQPIGGWVVDKVREHPARRPPAVLQRGVSARALARGAQGRVSVRTRGIRNFWCIAPGARHQRDYLTTTLPVTPNRAPIALLRRLAALLQVLLVVRLGGVVRTN